MTAPEDTAQMIADNWTERIRLSLLNDDITLFEARMALPCDIETFDGQKHLTTSEDREDFFQAVCAYHKKSGVSEIDRHVLEAVFNDTEKITLACETRLLNGTALLQDPYPVFSILKLTDGCWKVVKMTFAITDRNDHNAALLSAGKQRN